MVGAISFGVAITYFLNYLIDRKTNPEVPLISGAMLYVVFGEILPQSILMYHSKLPAFSAIAGILAGLLIIF